MKWLFAIVLVLVVGAVAAFAIYTFGYRGREREGDRRVARALARENTPCVGCRLIGVEEVAPSIWRAVFEDPGNRNQCIA